MDENFREGIEPGTPNPYPNDNQEPIQTNSNMTADATPAAPTTTPVAPPQGDVPPDVASQESRPAGAPEMSGSEVLTSPTVTTGERLSPAAAVTRPEAPAASPETPVVPQEGWSPMTSSSAGESAVSATPGSGTADQIPIYGQEQAAPPYQQPYQPVQYQWQQGQPPHQPSQPNYQQAPGAAPGYTQPAPNRAGEPAATTGPNFTMRDPAGPLAKREAPVEKPKKKKGQLVAIILIVVLAFGAGFGGGLAANYFVSPGGSGTVVSNDNNSIIINPDSSLDTAEAIAAKVIPSVVGISTTSEQLYQGWFGTQRGVSQGAGTGLVVDEKGYILTNSHVVNDGNTTALMVQLADGREVDGEVLWNDPTLDLAIVKIEADNLQAAELGDSEEVRIGAYAVAIGNPLGNFNWSLTQGVISGLDRTITVSSGSGSQVSTMDGLMQTDASINSGNSGGPLLNSRGEVIGINTAKVQSGEGLGFAIPINIAKPIVEQIKETGEYNRAYIGISGVSVEVFLAYFPETALGIDEGIYITAITADGGAEKAGLAVGDVIIAVEGEDVKSMEALQRKIIQYRAGDTINLTVMRNQQERQVDVTLS